MSNNCCYTTKDEYSFLMETIDNFKKMLTFMSPGTFGAKMSEMTIYETEAAETETIVLKDAGLVAYIYFKMFGSAQPTNPTPEEIDRINYLWTAIGKPENKIPT